VELLLSVCARRRWGTYLIICFFPQILPGPSEIPINGFPGWEHTTLLFVRSNNIMARPRKSTIVRKVLSPHTFPETLAVVCACCVHNNNSNSNNNNDITLSRMRRGIKSLPRVTISFCRAKRVGARCRALISKLGALYPFV